MMSEGLGGSEDVRQMDYGEEKIATVAETAPQGNPLTPLIL